MKITNLITILEAIRLKHGDIDVVINNLNANNYPLSYIDVNDCFDVNNGFISNTATAQINYEG